MSALPPDNRERYERGIYERPEQPDPDVVQRQSIVTVVLLAFAALLILSFVATRGARDGASTFLGAGVETNAAGNSNATGNSAETTATTAPEATTTTVMAPIKVESVPGAAIIAEHISCKGENSLSDDATVQAAVAADNNTPSTPGGAPKPYANDEQAQNEIVQASMQELHEEFYANCSPVPGTGSTTAGSGSSTGANGAALPTEPLTANRVHATSSRRPRPPPPPTRTADR